MQRHLNQTGSDLEELIGTRSRAITRKLAQVQQLEPDQAADLLGLADSAAAPGAPLLRQLSRPHAPYQPGDNAAPAPAAAESTPAAPRLRRRREES